MVVAVVIIVILVAAAIIYIYVLPKPSEAEVDSFTFSALPTACFAPIFIGKEEGYYATEGFTGIVDLPMYKSAAESKEAAALGKADWTFVSMVSAIVGLDKFANYKIVAGLHVGCHEIIAQLDITSVNELEGKTVAIPGIGSTQHLVLLSALYGEGVDPEKVDLVVYPSAEMPALLKAGKIDAAMGWPPIPEICSMEGIGHTILSTTLDPPWSDHMCCVLIAHTPWMEKNPEALRRVIKATYLAAAAVDADPPGMAKVLIDKGYAKNLPATTLALAKIPWLKFKFHHPEETIIYYAEDLYNFGITTHDADWILEGCDWSYYEDVLEEMGIPIPPK